MFSRLQKFDGPIFGGMGGGVGGGEGGGGLYTGGILMNGIL